MTLEEALKVNPYDSSKGNESAYVRYLRYTVDGFYELDSGTVKQMWEEKKNDTDNDI